MNARSTLAYGSILLALGAMFIFGARWASGQWLWALQDTAMTTYTYVTSANGVLIFKDAKGDLWWMYRNLHDGGAEFGLQRVKVPQAAGDFLDASRGR